MVTAAMSFNGKQKAAAVLLSVDAGVAAEIMRGFSEDELASIAFEMNNMGKLEPRAEASVLHEFSVRASTDNGPQFNPNAIRERLTMALGNDGAINILKDIGLENDIEELFRPLRDLEAEELHGLLADEHLQTVAITLAQLDSKSSANVLACFPEECQVDVVRRMASTKHTDENMIRRVGQIMQQKMGTVRETHQTPEDPRYKRVADMINNLGSDAEERILAELSSNVPEMAEKLRDMMFVFEDTKSLSDDDIRKVLMSVDTQVLAMALKTASDDLKEKVFSNLSRRATETVTEELELLGPKPLSQVKSAQQKIVGTIRKMSSAGEVNLKCTVAEEDPLV